MNAKLILIPIFLIGSCVAQVDQALLNELFPPQTSKTYEICGINKVCVRQYLCTNGELEEYGAGMIGMRMGELCNIGIETCCDFSKILDKRNLNPLPLTVGCGYRNKNGVGIKIKEIIDNDAEFGEFPWMVVIWEKMINNGKVVITFKCGGSLIAPNVVLTGAHCVNGTNPLNIQVRAGEWEFSSNAEPYPHQDRQVVDIIMHENFNADNLKNNIALLFLETPFDDAPHINTVCLPPANINFDKSHCFASGWGVKNFGTEYRANILRKINLPVVSNDVCQENLRLTRLGPYFKLHSSFMCAGGEIGKDTCKGDGGSPLVCPMADNSDRFYQVGIVSWGIGCGDENVPGVYANVPAFRSWIDEKLAYKGIETGSFTT